MGEDQKPQSTGSRARGGGRLGFATLDQVKKPKPPAVTSARQGRIPITLKGEIDALLASGKVGGHALILDDIGRHSFAESSGRKGGERKRFCQTPRPRANKSEQHVEWKTACEQFPGESFGAAQRVYT